MNSTTKKSLIAAILVLFAVSMRVIDHPFNATPMVAIMLFSSAVFEKWSWKIGVPLAAMLSSDILLEVLTGYGFHDSIFLVYNSFALVFAIGLFTLKKISALKVLASSVISSLVFFLITNFAFFYPAAPVSNPVIGQYSHDFSGIMASYAAGVPFYKNMFVGDIVFSVVLFGSYYILTNFVFKKSLRIA